MPTKMTQNTNDLILKVMEKARGEVLGNETQIGKNICKEIFAEYFSNQPIDKNLLILTEKELFKIFKKGLDCGMRLAFVLTDKKSDETTLPDSKAIFKEALLELLSCH